MNQPQCPVCGRHTTDPIAEHSRRTMELRSTNTRPCEASGLTTERAQQLPIARAQRALTAPATLS